MSKMYVWEVVLELQWKTEWTENKKKCTNYWEDNDVKFTVAAPSGKEAILKAEKLALAKDSWVGERYCDDGSTVPSKETPYKVLDVVSLELKETLDG